MTQGQSFHPVLENKKVVIFDATRQENSIEEIQTKKETTKRTLRWRKPIGFIFLFLSFTTLSLFLSPRVITPKIIKEKNKGFEPVIAKEVKPTKKNFLLSIDQIGLINTKVIPQVDIADEAAYTQALKEGVVHAKQSNLPGEGKMVYIFGHSTNYPWFIEEINALFYEIETLEIGGGIKVEYNGELFFYKVTEKKIVEANQVEVIKENQNKNILILQSCWPPGTIWKRLLIFAEPNKDIYSI